MNYFGKWLLRILDLHAVKGKCRSFYITM